MAKGGHGVFDTSQKGDWDSWRNERLDGRAFAMDLDSANVGALPAFGTLELDFVSSNVNFRKALGMRRRCMSRLCFYLFSSELNTVKFNDHDVVKHIRRSAPPVPGSGVPRVGGRGGGGTRGTRGTSQSVPLRASPRPSVLLTGLAYVVKCVSACAGGFKVVKGCRRVCRATSV